MGAAGRILITERLYLEAHLCEARCGCTAGKSRADYYNIDFPLVGGVYKVLVFLIVGPLVLQVAFGDFGIQCCHIDFLV